MPLTEISARDATTILLWDGDTFDANQLRGATIVENEGEYKLYYSGLPFWNTLDLGLATSVDGVTFTRYSNDQLISPVDEPDWASFRWEPTTVMFDEGIYKMWFWGNDTNLFTDSNNTHGFGYATSSDGINWNVYQDAIRVESGSREGARLIEVVKQDGNYIAYYLDMSQSGNTLMRAVSSDGYHFNGDYALPFGAEYTLHAATISDDGKIVGVWTKDGQYYLAESTDGWDFELTHTVSLPERFGVRDLVIKDGTISFYSSTSFGNVDWSGGNAAIQVATASYTPGAERHELIFSDDFGRPDSADVGNGWIEVRENPPEDPNYTGSATLYVEAETLKIDFDAEGVTPPRNASQVQPYMTHDLSADVGGSGFEVEFSFAAGDDERLVHMVAMADSSAGQIGDDVRPFLIPGSGIGIAVVRSDSLDPTSGFQLFRFDGDSDLSHWADGLFGEGTASFDFESGQNVDVSFLMEADGNWRVELSSGTSTDVFTGSAAPLNKTLDQIVVSTIDAGYAYYGNQSEIVSLDNINVYALGDIVTPEPDRFEVNVAAAMQLSAAAYWERGDENPLFNPTPPTQDQIDAYESLVAFDDSQVRLLGDDELGSVALKGGLYVNENAAALVALAGDTLVVSFRGTDDLAATLERTFENLATAASNAGPQSTGPGAALRGLLTANGRGQGLDEIRESTLLSSVPEEYRTSDVQDWFNMDGHWGLLEPLVDAVDAYVAASGISKVFVTGHSLGAAMANAYMLTHESNEAVSYSSITYASPGLTPGTYSGVDVDIWDVAPTRVIEDERVLNFVHDEDIINFPNRVASVIVGKQVDVEVRLDDGSMTGVFDQHLSGLYLASSGVIEGTGLDIFDFKSGGALDLDRVELRLKDDGSGITIDDAEWDGSTAHSKTLLLGTSGENLLSAENDEQVIAGLEGNDTIQLEIFNDLLFQFFDPGKSTVLFRNGDGIDRIFNFNPEEDQVLLIGLDLGQASVTGDANRVEVIFEGGDSLLFEGIDRATYNEDWFLTPLDDPMAMF